MANILILSIVFPPDSASTANIIKGLADEFVKAGHKIYVITTVPHNNISNRDIDSSIINKYFLNLFYKSNDNAIETFRIWLPQKSKSKYKRMFSWLLFCFLAAIIPILVVRKIDIVICCTPPHLIGISADIISRAKKIPFIYNVQEIYPDIAILSGQINNRFIIYILKKIEIYIYKRASCITVIGEVMGKRILNKGVNIEKIKIIPNFVDTEHFNSNTYPLYRYKFNLDHKFIFGYAGNFGIAQDIDAIIDLAYLLKNNQNIYFLLAGSGIYYDLICNKIKTLNLKNIILLGHQSHNNMSAFYASANILFVPLKNELAKTALPSKVLEIMACEKPVIAITDKDSDLANMIEKAKCGYVINKEDLYDIAIKCIVEKTKLEQLGKNGKEYVLNIHTKNKIGAAYLDLINKILQENNLKK